VSVGLPVSALRAARAGKCAIIGFSIYNLEQGLGVIRAAEHANVPVLLQAGSSAFSYAGREPLAQLALGLASGARVPVGIHLDHATDPAEIEACLELGYTSVMVDGSALPFDENVRLTRAIVDRAHHSGAWVEAELAGIAGDEDQSTRVSASELTDPARAAELVASTGVDALAVSIGNVHGIPEQPVTLDLGLLAEIAQVVDAPLVLHGTSGLSDDQVRAAIDLGVAKLNVNTELRWAFREGLETATASLPTSDGLAPLMATVVDACSAAALDPIRSFSVAGPGSRGACSDAQGTLDPPA
jgi:ketose-bisphosphate aldolase